MFKIHSPGIKLRSVNCKFDALTTMPLVVQDHVLKKCDAKMQKKEKKKEHAELKLPLSTFGSKLNNENYYYQYLLLM